MLAENDAAINRSAIRVHVEDRQEDADAASSRSQNVAFFDFDDVGNRPVRGGDDRVWIRWNAAFGIPEKIQRVSNQDDEEEEQPNAKKQTTERDNGQNRKDPAGFDESLEAHGKGQFSKHKTRWSR